MSSSKPSRDVFGTGVFMAIRYREKYKTWQVYWNNPFTGKRESKSFANKKDAEKANSLVIHRLKYEPESFRPEEPEGTETTTRTLEHVYLEYLYEKQFSKREVSTHRCHFQYVLSRFGEKNIAEISKADLEAIKQYYISNCTTATANARLRILRTIVYFAVAHGYMQPVAFPKIPSPNYKQFVPPSLEELTSILTVAPPHLQRVIIMGAYFGVRVGQCELFQLTWNDIDLTKKIVRVHGSKKNNNAAWREVPIRDDLVGIFIQWQEDDLASGTEYLIHYAGKPVKSIKHSWATALKFAGITRRIRPYDLRHMFGTELVAAGVDIGTVAKLMGHSSPTMLLTHYQYIMDRQKKDAVEALPNSPLCAAPMCRKESTPPEKPANP